MRKECWISGPGPIAPNNRTLEFFLCGRKAGAGMAAFSIMASCIGGTATIAMLALAARAGWPAFWWLGSGSVGLGLLGLFFAKKIRASRAATLPEILDMALGPQCRLFASVIVLLSSLAIVAAQFNAIGVILSAFAGLDFGWSVILGSSAIWLYTSIGGQSAVMKSDIWQFVLLAGALVIALLWLLRLPECAAVLSRAPLVLANRDLPLSRVVYFITVFGGSFTIGPMIFGRILSARSPRAAKSGALLAALGLAVMAALIAAMGIAMSGLPLESASPEQILLAVCNLAFPRWLVWLLIIGLVAAVVSSADSCLLTAAIICSHDLHLGGTVRATRLAMTIIAIASCLIVFGGKGILGLLLAASDIYTCGIVAPVIVLLLGGKKLRPAPFLAAMTAGGLCGLAAAISGNYFWSFAGLGLSAALAIAGLPKKKNGPINLP